MPPAPIDNAAPSVADLPPSDEEQQGNEAKKRRLEETKEEVAREVVSKVPPEASTSIGVLPDPDVEPANPSAVAGEGANERSEASRKVGRRRAVQERGDTPQLTFAQLSGIVFPCVPSTLGHAYTSDSGLPMPATDTVVPYDHPKLRLHRIYYDYTVPAGLICGKLRDRPPNLKLGGICGDVTEAVIANLIFFLSGVRVACIDMFKPQQGRCAIWLQSPDEFALLFGAMDHKVWMAPVNSNAAIFVTDPDSYAYLLQFLESLRGGAPCNVRFPRHCVLVEPWIPKTEKTGS